MPGHLGAAVPGEGLRIGSVSLRNAWATAAVTVALVASVTGSRSR
jgi:hypothetical protein